MTDLLMLFTVLMMVTVDATLHTPNNISNIQMNETGFPVIDRAATLAGMSPYGYRGDAKRVHEALRRDLDQNKNLTIVVLGASVAMGHGMYFWDLYRYSHVLEGFLADIFQVNVTVHNFAIRAAASDTQAQFLFQKHMQYLLASSLVLVDISVNDRPSHRDVKNEAEKASRFMSLNQSQEAVEKHIDQQERVFAEGRQLMKLLQYYLPKTIGIVYFETFVSGGRTSPLIRSPSDLAAALGQGFTNGNYEHLKNPRYTYKCKGLDIAKYYHWQPLVEYKIPVISYLDMLCPFVLGPTHYLHAGTAFWGPNLHHGEVFHRFNAVMLAHVIHEYATNDISETSLDGELPHWMPHQGAVSKQQISEWNAYIYNTSTDAALNLDTRTIKCAVAPLQTKMTVVDHGSDWRYYEDVPGKPGWISTTARSSVSDVDQQRTAASRALVGGGGREEVRGLEVRSGGRSSDRRRLGGRKSPVQSSSSSRGPPRSITFSVKMMRVQPVIKISVLMSYDLRMGVLRCCVEPYGPTYCKSIDTLWADQTSQISTVDVAFPDFPDDSKKPVLSRDLVCTADAGKVKIVHMMTC